VHEVKFDGWRIQINVLSDTVSCFTRNGLDWTKKAPTLAKQARALDKCIIDGELCASYHCWIARSVTERTDRMLRPDWINLPEARGE
jgi:hypothetical protein